MITVTSYIIKIIIGFKSSGHANYATKDKISFVRQYPF